MRKKIERHFGKWGSVMLLILFLGCSGCMIPKAVVPIPFQLLKAPDGEKVERLVIFFPGRKDSPQDFIEHGFLERLWKSGVNADALLVNAHLGYYASETLTERFELDILPLIEQGDYQEVWVVGISLGSLGVLLLDQDHPGIFDKMVLIAPFLGNKKALLKELQTKEANNWDFDAAGLERDFQVKLWEHLQAVSDNEEYLDRILLGYGGNDRFVEWQQIFGTLFSSEQIFVDPEGKHRWNAWERIWERMCEHLALKYSDQN